MLGSPLNAVLLQGLPPGLALEFNMSETRDERQKCTGSELMSLVREEGGDAGLSQGEVGGEG
jgi:hypothetical protein